MCSIMSGAYDLYNDSGLEQISGRFYRGGAEVATDSGREKEGITFAKATAHRDEA